MASHQVESSSLPSATDPNIHNSTSIGQDTSTAETSPKLSTSGITSWAKSLKIPKPSNQDESQPGSSGKSPFARLTSGIGFRLSPKSSQQDESAEGTSTPAEPGVFGSLTKGLMDSSRSAVKAVQVKARHMVSQNKRRYQEGGFDLDMTYITENIIAMGFPAGDMSSGFFGYVEGFYRNHMEEVIKFFETHHKGKYKVYNLCSERLYDASLFEGKVACFPFDDHNCPPIQLITLFCQSAYSWLKEDIENVVVVHCKAGMARTGLMISSLLLYLKFFPTAEESMDYYNQKRCVDGKGLVLPSQIRYVKYFEHILTYSSGENQPGRRCMLRGFRLHRCPHWVRPSITISNHNGVLFSTKKHPRTKDLAPEDFWFSAPKKGIMVFALPGEPGLTELAGDFKIHFHDRQGDFYCWLNTTMMENRKILSTSELDGFDKRKLPSPGFQVEIVLVDYEFFFPSLNLPTLQLSLLPSNSTALVTAIELFSAPDGLFPPSASAVDGNVAHLDGRVLEVLHRVNAGGPRVTPDNDTLWRTWVEDDGFVAGASKGDTVTFSERINYPPAGATPETAPETVYGTAREMGWRGNSSGDLFNLTWLLPVPRSDHGYLVRLHFCDIVSKALYELYFDVYINGYSAYTDLDLSSQYVSLASPYYIDFAVGSSPAGSIRISVGPSERSPPSKTNAMLNGLEILKIHGVARFSEPRGSKSHWILIGLALGCLVVVVCSISGYLAVIALRRRRKGERRSGDAYSRLMELTATNSPSMGSNLNPSLKIPIAEIIMATNNFDEGSQVGCGGFGKVYKGVLRDGTAVAVKRCCRDRRDGGGSGQGQTEFQAEILVLTKIRHRHLVSLIGYCEERSEMILVYEFMANGPLRDHLYGADRPRLSWKRRLEICIGSARGLHYLHTGTARGAVIHRDVKSSNILLDEGYAAKVADFGLSRAAAGAGVGEREHVSTGVKGSFGYLDPEYFRTQQLTDKSDVYSFGVVMLEVLCARPVIDRSLSWEEVNLAEWGMKWQRKGQLGRIVDPALRGEIDSRSLRKFGETAEKCLAQYGVDRPAMGDVLWSLECVLQLHESGIRREPFEDCSSVAATAGSDGEPEGDR